MEEQNLIVKEEREEQNDAGAGEWTQNETEECETESKAYKNKSEHFENPSRTEDLKLDIEIDETYSIYKDAIQEGTSMQNSANNRLEVMDEQLNATGQDDDPYEDHSDLCSHSDLLDNGWNPGSNSNGENEDYWNDDFGYSDINLLPSKYEEHNAVFDENEESWDNEEHDAIEWGEQANEENLVGNEESDAIQEEAQAHEENFWDDFSEEDEDDIEVWHNEDDLEFDLDQDLYIDSDSSDDDVALQIFLFEPRSCKDLALQKLSDMRLPVKKLRELPLPSSLIDEIHSTLPQQLFSDLPSHIQYTGERFAIGEEHKQRHKFIKTITIRPG